jgi:hypothetical protein
VRQDRRGSWYLLTGAVLGVTLGLFYAWVVSPVKYIDAPPYALRADYKEQYRILVAAAFLYNNDLLRATDRLAQLKDDESAQTIALQAQQALDQGHPEEEIRALNLLATALSRGMAATPSTLQNNQTPTPQLRTSEVTPSPIFSVPTETMTTTVQASAPPTTTLETPSPALTMGPSPTATPTATQGAPFVLQDTRLMCNQTQTEPLIQVEVFDAAGQPVPGVELVVTWEDGEDHFFTGLQPELGLGYGDFKMTPGVLYTVNLTDGGQPVNDLSAAGCVLEDGSQYWGSWYLTFVQP